MGLKCQITYKKGQALVYDKDGELSQLYIDALNVTGNQKEALNLWATSQLESFQQMTNTNENPTISDVIKFYDTVQSDGNTLSAFENFQVKRFMQTNGFSSLSETFSVLQSIFKPEGILTLNTEAAIGSGLYSTEEINSLELEAIGTVLSKMEGQLTTGDIFVEPQPDDFFYKNSDYRTLLGTYEKVSVENLDEDLNQMISDFSNEQELYSKIQELPYVDFVNRFFSDQTFAQNTLNRLKGLRKIPILSYVNGQLTDQNVSYYTTLKNTILGNVSPIIFEANYDYLSSIDFTVWQENLNEISQVLREIEEQAAEANIDIVGLSTKASDIPGVMTLMKDLVQVLNAPTENNMLSFSNSHTRLFGTQNEAAVVDRIPDQYEGLNIVKVFSNLSDNQLFSTDGLLPIGDNYYHKVQVPANKMEMYEFLYNRLIEGNFAIPDQFNLGIDYADTINKAEVLGVISEYVMSRDVGFETNLQEDASLNQLVFEHIPIAQPNVRTEIASVIDITYDEMYLRGSFISDFYNYVLSEKLDNSQIYREVLSKFQINDRDISLLSPVESIDDIEYSEELKDYIRLKKDRNMKYLAGISDSPVMDDLLFLNDSSLIPETKEYFVIDGDFSVMKSSPNSFVRIQNRLYRKVLDSNNISLYRKIGSTLSPVYYTNNLNFEFDREIAEGVLKKYINFNQGSTNYGEFQETVSRSQVQNPLRISQPVLRTPESSIQAFQEELQASILNGGLIPDNIKASKNIELSRNKVTVSFSPGSKINTSGRAFSVNERFFKQIRENLKNKLGPVFEDRFVQKVKGPFSFSVEVNIPPAAFQAMIQQEIAMEDEIMDVSGDILGIVESEISRGIDTEVLEDIGYDLDGVVEQNDQNDKLENVSAVFNSKLELLNLYSLDQGENILNQIDSCG